MRFDNKGADSPLSPLSFQTHAYQNSPPLKPRSTPLKLRFVGNQCPTPLSGCTFEPLIKRTTNRHEKPVFLAALPLPLAAIGQTTTLRGRILDERGQVLPGANVFLRGTYDGANTDSSGAFRFTTTRKDTAILAVSFVGYEPFSRKITLPATANFTINLREEANMLNTVVITAGSFEASDEKRMTMLKTMDFVTTAGAGADTTAVVSLMPGAQRVGEQEGIFVRGDSAQESKVVIDGLIVQNPFFSSLPDVQQRGRFQPFMFKSTAFSTGGYSAQYGQALLDLLLLNITDKGNNNGLSLNLTSTGLTFDQANEKSSFSSTAYYGTPETVVCPREVARNLNQRTQIRRHVAHLPPETNQERPPETVRDVHRFAGEHGFPRSVGSPARQRTRQPCERHTIQHQRSLRRGVCRIRNLSGPEIGPADRCAGRIHEHHRAV